MNSIEHAVSCFNQGFNCAQSVFSAFSSQLGLPSDIALKIGAPFGAGVGRMGEVCGAVNGAMMVIGLKFGHINADDVETKEEAYGMAKKFINSFRERNGSIICRELLKYDLSKPEEYKMAQDQGLFTSLCPKLVQDAAEIISEILT